MNDESRIRQLVRDAYGSIARGDSRPGCCGSVPAGAEDLAAAVGYSRRELDGTPGQANLGLGCGNPTAIGNLRPGETVLDLGCGAGMDCFLAARKVGPAGRVIGVDMTADMIDAARANAAAAGAEAANVEFRLGEIEKLPLEDAAVDVVISNCVINLSPDKEAVFSEIARVLKPGGRVIISDIVLTGKLPASLADDISAYTACVSGAVTVDAYRSLLERAGLKDIAITTRDVAAIAAGLDKESLRHAAACCPGEEQLKAAPIASAYITARRQRGA